MGSFFFDESIQERGRFIIGAFVYTDYDPTPAVYAALLEAGRTPGSDEFKSSARMSGDSRLKRLRARLNALLFESKIGILVIPSGHRSELGNEALRCLNKILHANKLIESAHTIYFDEGIKVNQSFIDQFQKNSGGLSKLLLNQDSKIIGGLQLADLTSHYLGTMLLEQIGKIGKKGQYYI